MIFFGKNIIFKRTLKLCLVGKIKKERIKNIGKIENMLVFYHICLVQMINKKCRMVENKYKYNLFGCKEN